MRADGLGRWLRALPDEVVVHTWLPCLDGQDLARCVGVWGLGVGGPMSVWDGMS